MAVEGGHTKPVMKQVRNELDSVIHAATRDVVPDTMNKSVKGLNVLHRAERAVAAPMNTSLSDAKLHYKVPAASATKNSLSRAQRDRKNALVANFAINRSLPQVVHK